MHQDDPTRSQAVSSRWHPLPSTVGQTSLLSAAALALGAIAGWTYLLTQSVGLGTIIALVIAASGTVLATAMAVFAYGYYSMRYEITADALVLSCLWIRDTVPLGQIEGVYGSKRLGSEPRVKGILWRGLHIGELSNEENSRSLIYATGLRPSAVVVITTSDSAYALTPADAEGFRSHLIRRLETLSDEEIETAPAPSRKGSLNPAASLLSDRLSVTTLAIALAALVAAFFIVGIRLPGLPAALPLHLGPTGMPDFVQSPSEAFRLPIAGMVIFVINAAISVVLHLWQRDAARVLAGSTLFIQLVGLIAVLRVVH